MNKRGLVLVLSVAFLLTACVKGSDSGGSPNPNAGFQARFAPLSGVLPFPNDLYFNGSTTGTLNIPVVDPTSPANGPLVALNHLDGYGTQSVVNAYFTESLDPTSLNAGDVLVFKVSSNPLNKAINPPPPGGSGAAPQLLVQGASCTAGIDYTVGVSSASDSGGTVLNITPCKPLAASSIQIIGLKPVPVPATYLVVLTNGIKDTNGDTATASADYQLILNADLPVLSGGQMGTTGNPQLDQVAQFTLPQLAVAAGAGLNPQNIVLTFSFSTQFIGTTFAALEANTPAGTGAVADTGLTTKQINSALPGLAEVFAGTLTIPYYLSVATPSNPTPALTGYWHTANGGDTTVLNPMPASTGNVTIPMLVTIPDSSSGCGTKPAAGWPVVIFQHGITQNRENVFAVADGLAKSPACTAAVAIDLPLHGITTTTDPFYDNQLFASTPAKALVVSSERTFNLPEVAPVFSTPSSTIAPSGSYFINLSSLLTSRDNLREAVADLISLRKGLGSITQFGTTTTLFDASSVGYVGHSLGGIVGTVFLGVDTGVVPGTLANPGGNITQLLLNSPSFAPQINAGLQAQGIIPGTQFYDDFFRNAQAVIGAGDPANYAAAAAANHPIHMIEVVGGLDACSLPDQVVPNSSTNLLASLMNLTQFHAGTNNTGTAVHGIVKFTAGTHGSLLSPAPPPNCSQDATLYGGVTLEMQTEMATFMASHGTDLPVGNFPFVQ